METKRSFFSFSNLPKVECSPAGKKVYQYNVLNSTGKLVSKEKNIYEMVQSFKNQVDYKKRFNEGDLNNDGELAYFDTTKLSMDYLANLASITNGIRQKVEVAETDKATSETNKANVGNGETQPSATVIQPSVVNTAGGATTDGKGDDK